MTEAADYVRHKLGSILDVLKESDVQELELREAGTEIRIHRDHKSTIRPMANAAPLQDVTDPPDPGLRDIVSPLVGTFYRAGHAGAPPLVSEGSVVESETIVGIVEALQVLTEIESGHDGVIARVRATDGQPVEYGQVLFEVALRD